MTGPACQWSPRSSVARVRRPRAECCGIGPPRCGDCANLGRGATQGMTEAVGRDARMVPAHPFALDRPPAPARSPRSRPLVLLVDDIEDCRHVDGQFLRFTGCAVVESADSYGELAAAVLSAAA